MRTVDSDAGLVTQEQAEQAPNYTILSRYLGLKIGRADLVIKVRQPDRSLARLLGTHPSEWRRNGS